MIISTLCVAVIYGIVAVVAAGVLPVEQVAGENLSIVAKEILSGPVYVFFMFCGAGFALISTLNSQFAWAPKPIMQACDDGWLPHNLAKLSKWNTPVVLLGILYVIGVVCILTGLSVSILGNMCLVANGVITFMINCSVFKLPSVVSEAWDKSRFHCSKSMLMLITVLGSVASAFNIYLNASRLSHHLLLINVVVIVVAFVFGTVREKKATVEVSYEEA
jgi:APA family basic amino acid/polyamine antiporter